MLRIATCLAAVLLIAGTLHTASAQTTAAAPAVSTDAKPSKMKLTSRKAEGDEGPVDFKQAQARQACRKEVKSKGLAGDDRWFYISDCMAKS